MPASRGRWSTLPTADLDAVARAAAGASSLLALGGGSAIDTGKGVSALLGLPLSEGEISPCWRCVDHVVCTCKLDPAQCDCAVQPHPHR